MADQKSPTGKPRVTPGTNRQVQQARVFAGAVAGSQTGNTPGTAARLFVPGVPGQNQYREQLQPPSLLVVPGVPGVTQANSR